ncbi:hypothetical protein ACWGCF_44980, partial [Streptomyces sp. NPDC055039]
GEYLLGGATSASSFPVQVNPIGSLSGNLGAPHFVRGSASPSLLTQWWEENRPTEVLHSREREAVLEGWLSPLM